MRSFALLLVGFLVACAPEPQGAAPPDAEPEPVCSPGASQECYTGAGGTEGVGVCRSGTITCDPEGFWGPCVDQLTPAQDVCGNNLDENCDGTADNETDLDEDGFTNCAGDCCDHMNENCADPELINPGAFESDGNMLDDDCDGTADNALVACDEAFQSDETDPMDYARTIDLCQTATEDPGDLRWGVISARYALADGTGAPDTSQYSIRSAFGSTTNQGGEQLVVLSSGRAAATGQQSPMFAAFQPGISAGTVSGFPTDWYAEHANMIPNSPGCPAPEGGVANDPIMFEVRVRTPTNARSFSLRTNFFSSEYPEWTCSPFNDFFVVLLDSAFDGTPANPTDKNLATYTSGAGDVYPVGVNLAYGNTGLFRVCEDGATGCATGATDGNITTCTSTVTLNGTGFDVGANAAGSCGNNDRVGGATGWLTTRGNVVGGEIITLRVALWDSSDHALDSVALIDNFKWSVDVSDPGTVVD